jgi:ribonuclease R
MMASKWVGEDLDGTISGVTRFGLFVILDNIYTEGLLHIKDLEDDYYYFDEKNFCIIGRKTRTLFRMGKRLKVKIARVNVEKRKVDLRLVKF